MTAIFKKLILLFFFFGICSPSLFSQNLHLNEILSSNETTLADEDGDFEDWIEITNLGDEPINLSGFGLSDDEDEPFKWTLPDTTIQAGDFMVIWASDKDRATPGSELHTNFGVSADGEEIFLTHSDGTLLDQSPERELEEDISIGRQLDGTGEWFRFDEPTPGEPNTTEAIDDPLEEPGLSHDPGFYTTGFNLEISHSREDVTFYYTLDGSTPTEESAVYDGPISINDRSSEPNVYSTIPTNFMGGRYGFREPDGLIPKGTVLRVKAVKEGFRPAHTTYSFFVFPEGKSKHQLPLISITTDSLNFFGDEEGIYVPGDHYDGRDHTGNYYQRGEEWERESSFEFFDEDGEQQVSQNVGVRIHGSFTRRYAQKSLRIYARGEYGEGSINYEIFPGQEYDEYERLVLRNSGNDQGYTMFRDAAAHEVVKHFNMETQAYRPSVLYINGEYWGIHNIRERFDDNYLERVYGVDGDNIDYLSNRWEIEYGSNWPYQDMVNFIDSKDLSVEANMDSVKTLMEIDYFLDYYTAEIYFLNTDWPHGNIEFWRRHVPYDRNEPHGLDGRWRWLFYDLDAGFGFVEDPDFDMLHYVTKPQAFQDMEWPNPIIRNLLENEYFKHDFINRMADHLNTSFRTDRVLDIIDRYQGQIAPEMPQFIERWHYPARITQWNGFVNGMRDFAEERPGFLWQNILDHFEIESTETITVDLEDTDQGKIRVNSLLISSETPGIEDNAYPWTGTYFSGIPVTLKTDPEIGYHLSHWVVDGKQVFEQELTVLPDTTEKISAIFDDLSLDDFEPYALSDTTYHFSEWFATQSTDTYPESMAFVYMDETEPGLDATIAGITQGAYNLESRTRINGLGEDGFTFINTSNEVGNRGYPGNRLDGAVLFLNTVGQGSVRVNWLAGTVEPNSRIYNLRLQYRTDTNEPFRDVLDDEGNPVEYERNEVEGHSQALDSVTLPGDADNQPNVQLLWRYYYTGERVDEESGQRSMLNISDITITSEPLLGEDPGLPPEVRLFQNYPNPFYPYTTIRYDLPSDQHVKIDLFSIDGRHVATLEDREAESGHHHVDLDVSGLATGIYLYRLLTDDFSEIKKMSVVK
ncbi:MAG: CotH kinase family protein [Balneolaceae bacterium]|nr:CotH kinase family protein [Balneolaceae bacterium]MDR9408698.1 CotH kinase family protein [Balneolaceae bacterium]